MCTVAGTGHRPSKLGGYDQNAIDWLTAVAFKSLRLLNPDTVISGMAMGWDMALADAAIGLNIPLVAAIPFEGQDRIWSGSVRHRYNQIVNKAVRVVYTSPPGYAPFKMEVRNRWMVDNADEILALWDGSTGGTKNAVTYAFRKHKPIQNAWPLFQRTGDLLEPIIGDSDVWQP